MPQKYQQSKTAQRAEELKKLLLPDSRPMRFFGMVGDFILLGVLWTVVCFPVITVGAATASLYRVTRHLLNHEGDSGILRDAIEGFRENFKQGTFVWLIVFGTGAFLFLDLWFYWLWAEGSAFGVVLFGLFAALLAVWLFVSVWIFGYISRFVCTLGEAFKNSLWLSFRHVGWTLAMVVSDIGLLVLSLNFPILLVVWPGMCAALNGWVFERVYRKIRVQIIGAAGSEEAAPTETEKEPE